MKPITIPLHLLIPTVISLAGLIFLVLKRNTLRRKDTVLYKSGLIFLFSYSLIVGNALGHDLYYQWDVNRYDINQDGRFSQKEITPAHVLAMERLTDDARRNSSFINACIVSGFLSAGIYSAMKISEALFGSEDKEDNINHIHTPHT